MAKNKYLIVSVIISFAFVAAITYGSTTIDSNVNTGGTLTVSGVSTLTGAVTMASTLAVTDDANFDANTLYVDASTNRVGVGIAAPNTAFEVVGTASTTNLVVGGNGTSMGGMIFGYCTIPTVSVAASSTGYADCAGATGIRSSDRVMVMATSSLPVNFVIQAASSTADATINVRIWNSGMIAGEATGANSFNFIGIR